MDTQETTAIRHQYLLNVLNVLTTNCPHKGKIENVKSFNFIGAITQQTTKVALQENNYKKECFQH